LVLRVGYIAKRARFLIMDILKENVLRLKKMTAGEASGHPWVHRDSLDLEDATLPDGTAATLMAADGAVLGSGVLDRRQPTAAWRRFSWGEGVAFDETYVADAIQEALGRRGAEGCQRLVSSDADYLPGLIVEKYDDVLTITAETAAVDAHLTMIAELLKEHFSPLEIVFLNDCDSRATYGLERGVRTLSGNNLKGRWVEIDEVIYRLDLMQPQKPRFYLDQREQHSLAGSLCEGRVVLDAFSHSGAFAMQALKGGAEHVVATDLSEDCVKAIGANAERNECFIETIDCDAFAFLAERSVGDFDCIILDPPSEMAADLNLLKQLHVSAFRCLPDGGVLATYCRSTSITLEAFERMVSAAAAEVGREGRIFARTGQPFDFPTLLNFPESNYLKGLILQVD
jgi:23S rRNA (cytosine1962-C5)-methyltransferase